jgi:PEP-CTERM motif
VSSVELPWYSYTYNGTTLDWALFDDENYWFLGQQGGSQAYINLEWSATDPSLADITTYCADQNCAGLPSGYSTFQVTVSDPPLSPVPEPGSLWQLGTGLLTVAGLARRRWRMKGEL